MSKNDKLKKLYLKYNLTPDDVFTSPLGKALARKGDFQIETFGESSPLNTKNKYPVAMAEKRSFSRAILKITGLYELAVFGEDESDEFKK